MAGCSKIKLTEKNITETSEWLKNSESQIPPAVSAVITTLLNMYALLMAGNAKLKNIRNFLAQQMGLVPKSEKIGSKNNDQEKLFEPIKRKLKKKRVKTVFEKSRTGQNHEILANNTPTHALEPSIKPEANMEKREKQHPIIIFPGENEINYSNSIINHGSFDSAKGGETMSQEEIKMSSPSGGIDIRLIVEEKTFELTGTKNIKTGEIRYDQHPEIAPGFIYTFRAIATLVALHVGHQLPLSRLADMIAIKGKNLAKSTIFSFVVHVAECFLPIFYVLVESLFSKAISINTDDTKEKTLRSEAEDLLCDETEIDSTPALDIARKVHDKLGLVSMKQENVPYKMNLTVFSGLINQEDPLSRIVLKISHFGCSGHLSGRLLEKFRDEKSSPSLWIVSDMLPANRPNLDIIKKYKINFAGCSSHARRGIWKNRSLDDLLWAVIRGFKALASLEEKLIRIGAGNKPEVILEWRKKHGKKIWKYITHYCVIITKKWPKGTEPFKAANYILNNEYELKRYLGVWYLPYTNNIAERLLRPEKLMLASSKFRSNLGGRVCYDIIASVMSTCLCNNLNFIGYTIDVLRNKTDVAINPERWTPMAWRLRQQQSKK